MTYEVTLVCGELANSMLDDYQHLDQVREEGNIETFSFGSKIELDAFMDGVDAAGGWLTVTVFDEPLSEHGPGWRTEAEARIEVIEDILSIETDPTTIEGYQEEKSQLLDLIDSEDWAELKKVLNR